MLAIVILSLLIQEIHSLCSSLKTPVSFEAATIIKPPPSAEKPKAIIVGSGPIGLSTALILSSPPHSYSVVVIDSNPEVVTYDVGKAFLYNINERGQTFTKHFPLVHEKLRERGVENISSERTKLMIVPGDPSIPLPSDGGIAIPNRVQTKGSSDPSTKTTTSYWIPRHEMVEVLMEVIDEYKEKHNVDITIMSGESCHDIYRDDNQLLVVNCQNIHSKELHDLPAASLVIGADGWKSKVRSLLGEGRLYPSSSKQFKVHSWISPATNLRVKVLQFPPQFTIPNTTQQYYTSSSDSFYAIRSIKDTPTEYLSLGLLPMKSTTSPRAVNIITRPNHALHQCTSVHEYKQWFIDNFPRFNFDTLVSDEEWERIYKEQGTRFPSCQYTNDMQLSHENTGVCLVGDAIHAFPPDIGQGINAGFMDVMELDTCLKQTTSTLSERLTLYENKRRPQVKALIRLARFGAPYQYNQPLRIDRFMKMAWTFNVVLRMLLNKVTFGFIPKSAFLLAQDHSLSYAQVMRRADLTTIALYSIFFTLFFTILKTLLL